MRRPLLCGCICLFLLVALWTRVKHPLPRTVDDTGGEGIYVALTGQVYQKEYRIRYGEEKIRDAVKYAKDLKDRYTVLWLYYFITINVIYS